MILCKELFNLWEKLIKIMRKNSSFMNKKLNIESFITLDIFQTFMQKRNKIIITETHLNSKGFNPHRIYSL